MVRCGATLQTQRYASEKWNVRAKWKILLWIIYLGCALRARYTEMLFFDTSTRDCALWYSPHKWWFYSVQCVGNASLYRVRWFKNRTKKILFRWRLHWDDMKRLCVIFSSIELRICTISLFCASYFFFAELHFRSIKQHFSCLVFFQRRLNRIRFFLVVWCD